MVTWFTVNSSYLDQGKIEDSFTKDLQGDPDLSVVVSSLGDCKTVGNISRTK